MAEDENETDATEEQPEAGGGMMKKLLFGGIGLLLVAAGIFGGPLVMNMISPPAEEAEETESAEEPAMETDGPALYTSLHPPLVVNFKDAVGDVHFMQITMEVMSRDQEIINAVREHAPVIRNNLILLYGSSEYEVIITRAGKEKMLADGLGEIQTVISDQTGMAGVEAVYFTSLVIQ